MNIKEIADIIGGKLRDAEGKEFNEIKDFETSYHHVNNKDTAYISPNSTTWSKELGRNKNADEGNDLIDRNNENIGLIITEYYINDLKYKIPQIIIKDSVKALKTLAIHIRNQYQNPIIAITGSIGKSSTRMLISSLLKDYKVLENRGNNNVRGSIYALMLKLITNPDFAVFEMSMNAINYRENTSQIVKPDITILTGIGAAHYSTFDSIQQIAELKARIFSGLNHDGIAIINNDTMHSDYLKNHASKYTQNILAYSLSNEQNSDIKIKKIEYHKGFIELSIFNDNKIEKYHLNTLSEGMVLNALAAILTLKSLKIPIVKKYFKAFKTFPKVLNMKQIETDNHDLTLIDDTHNASLPSMINAIKAFNSQAKFFSGNKVIALGKINDLGNKSKEIHLELLDVLKDSQADYILCLDDDLRPVVNKLQNKHVTWYPNKELLTFDLKLLCNEDALVLLKSSSGGTEFPSIARKLPNILKRSRIPNDIKNHFEETTNLGHSYLVIDNKTNEVIEEHNINNSMTIEGLGPLIYYLNAIDKNLVNTKIIMHEWPTNNEKYYKGKEINLYYLLEAMSFSPHPSLTYELSDYLFQNSLNRKLYIKHCINTMSLSTTICTNLTGRFRIKERQSFTVSDLFSIYRKYKEALFKFNNEFIIGTKARSGLIRGEDNTIIFTSYNNLDELRRKVINK